MAQFGVEIPFFGENQAAAVAPFSPTNIGGLAYWWVSSDLPVGITVSNWVDRIKGESWTNFSGTTCPTNSAIGLFFDGSNDILTNVGTINLGNKAGSSNSHWAVVSTGRIGAGEAPTILQSRTNGTSYYFGQFDNAGNPANRWSFGGTSPFFVTGWRTNALVFSDVTGVCDDAAGNMIGYTNAVPQETNAATGRIANNASWMYLGRDSAGAFFMKGYIKEIAVYTNKILSSVNISNLHYYATNLYGYTP